MRRLLSRLRALLAGRRPYVVRTHDPDEYARLCNGLILAPMGRETAGPARIDAPAWMEYPGVRVEYVPPSADELAAAVLEEAT